MIVVDAVWPAVAVGGAVLFGMGAYASSVVIPPPEMLVAVVVLLAHASFGSAIGWWLPRSASAAVALVLSYLWLVLPFTLESPSLRHLTGYWTSCCDSSATLAPEVIAGAISFNVAALVAALLVVANRSPVRVASAAIVGVLGVAGALALVADMGYEPLAPRVVTNEVCAASGETTVCLLPERDVSEASDVALALERARVRWASAGIVPGATVFSETPRGAQVVPLGYDPRMNTEALIRSGARGLIAAAGECRVGPLELRIAPQTLQEWLVATVVRDVRPDPDPDVRGTLEDVSSRSADSQATWFATTVNALRDCSNAGAR
jgi:hypothetical protein